MIFAKSCASLILLAAMFSLAFTAERPNILYIMSDDHAAHALSCYGSKINKTPNLDRLAKEGMLFENCFCTNSICGPSRAVILTGKYSHKNGFLNNGNTFDGAQPHLAKHLQKAGYKTAVIGKWHLKTTPTGFDHYEVLLGQGPYFNPKFKTPGGVVAHKGYTTDVITDRALAWLKENGKKKQPFFLMYHHKAPHANWETVEPYTSQFAKQEIPVPEDFFDDYAGRADAVKLSKLKVGPYQFNLHYKRLGKSWEEATKGAKNPRLWQYQRYLRDYLGCIQSVDTNVGRVLDYLDAAGLAENTIVVYTSDQGFFLGDHGLYDKRFMYEESIRMPLLVRWKGHVPAGKKADAMVANLDFAPTLLDAAGVDVQSLLGADKMQGASFLPVLKTGKTPKDWRTSYYYRFYERGYGIGAMLGVRTNTHKLIRFEYGDGERCELYDLDNDPAEMKNLYAKPEFAQVRKKLEAELLRLKKHYGDTKPIQ